VTSELASGSGRPKLTPKKSALALLLGAMLLPSGPVMAADYVGVTVESSKWHTLYSGDTATSTTINGGDQSVYGAKATSTTINSGGGQHVNNGGTSTETIINSSGTQNVSRDGLATSTTINSRGMQTVYSGGSAITPLSAKPAHSMSTARLPALPS